MSGVAGCAAQRRPGRPRGRQILSGSLMFGASWRRWGPAGPPTPTGLQREPEEDEESG